MIARFECPACGQSHSLEMPETVVYMTCSRTHKAVRLYITKGGDVRSALVDENGNVVESTQEED